MTAFYKYILLLILIESSFHFCSSNIIQFDDFVLGILDDVINKNTLENKLSENCIYQLKQWNASLFAKDEWAMLGF